jgi:hypothetical protein
MHDVHRWSRLPLMQYCASWLTDGRRIRSVSEV